MKYFSDEQILNVMLPQIIELCDTLDPDKISKALDTADGLDIRKNLYDYYGYIPKTLYEDPAYPDFRSWLLDPNIRCVGTFPLGISKRTNMDSLTLSGVEITIVVGIELERIIEKGRVKRLILGNCIVPKFQFLGIINTLNGSNLEQVRFEKLVVQDLPYEWLLTSWEETNLKTLNVLTLDFRKVHHGYPREWSK